MQLETPQVKSSDSVQDKNHAEHLSIQNQVIEGTKPGATKEANATATARLESAGGLPKISIINSADSAADLAANTAKSQPEAQTAKASTSDTPTTSGESTVTSNDLKQLNSSISNLKTDETALGKDPQSAQDLSKVNADETTLRTNELNYMHASAASSTFAEYSQSMAGTHAELKNVAVGLWNMGQKADAKQTTAYFPTSNYEKYFNKSTGTNPGNPGNPGGPTLNNETTDANIQNGTWNKNLIASEIGGKGINPNMQLSDSGNKLTATMSGGAWTDGLISNNQKLNPNDNTVQIQQVAQIAPGSNIHALETDLAITPGSGQQPIAGKDVTAMAASQLVFNPTTHTMELDTSGTNHQWVDAVNNIPMPTDGKVDYSMTVKLVGDKYEYTNVTVDGKSYALNADVSTFNMTQIGTHGWTEGEIHTQLQQDLTGKGGSSTVTYDDQINQGNS